MLSGENQNYTDLDNPLIWCCQNCPTGVSIIADFIQLPYFSVIHSSKSHGAMSVDLGIRNSKTEPLPTECIIFIRHMEKINQLLFLFI